MKREGRQHGMVRTSLILPPPFNTHTKTRYVNELYSEPTAGLFTKVSTKPTNHSKYTSKCCKPRCNICRLQPGHKSKSKTKGMRISKSGFDDPDLEIFGVSATDMLCELTNDHDQWSEDDPKQIVEWNTYHEWDDPIKGFPRRRKHFHVEEEEQKDDDDKKDVNENVLAQEVDHVSSDVEYVVIDLDKTKDDEEAWCLLD